MDVFEILKEYDENVKKVSEVNASMQEKMDFDSWKAYMQHRCDVMEESRIINKKVAAFLMEYVKTPVSDLELDKLSAAVINLYIRPEMDAFILVPLMNFILESYKQRNDTEKVIPYLYRKFNVLNDVLNVKTASHIDYAPFDELREFGRHPENLSQKSIRAIQASYFSSILVYPAEEYSIYRISQDKTYEIYLEYVNEFLPKIREDQKGEDFLQYDAIIHQAAVSVFMSLGAYSYSISSHFVSQAYEQYERKRGNVSHNYELDQGILRAWYSARMMDGNEMPECLLEEAFKDFMENPLNSPEGNNPYECVAYNNSETITEIASLVKDSPRRREIIKQVGERVIPAILSYDTESGCVGVQQLLYLWTMNSLQFMPVEEKIDLILNNIVKSQPSTYIHSKMVKRIAELLASCFYTWREDLFESLGMTFDEIIQYVGNAAILHDTGKIVIANVINTQERSLTDEEFAGIKRHPALGLRVLEGNPELLIYMDPILYHHKWYNGKGGYPDGDGNIHSPYRILIDIITLADCMDAATDNIGRSYKKAKDAYDVLDEFKRDAGVRYNPDLVAVMDKSPFLMEELERITTTERASMMYAEYRESLKNENNG